MRVRLAKVVLRFTNFTCSLIVLALVGTSVSIFLSTRALSPRNNMPAWAPNTPIWPQILILTVASLSMLLCLTVFYAWWRHGHKRAEKVTVYYTVFAMAFFVFSIVMWGVAAGVLHQSKAHGEGEICGGGAAETVRAGNSSRRTWTMLWFAECR